MIPLPSDDGKSPRGAIRNYQRWTRPPRAATIQKLADKHPTANIGAVTSASHLTVVDIDGGEDLVQEMIDRFGETPLMTMTPSGGTHLYYRSNGERNANLRSKGFDVDIKGTGGGIIVVPPSYRPSTGVPYSFISGSWDDLARLPSIRRGDLTEPVTSRSEIESAPSIGARNDTLFRFALRHAKRCADVDALIALVLTQNTLMAAPLPGQEIERLTRSAWGYDARGENWVGTEARAVIPRLTLEGMFSDPHGPDALALLTMLLIEHGARDTPFSVSPKGMAAAHRLNGWGEKRYRRARDILVGAGSVRRVWQGGKGPNDPSLYVLT